MKWDLLGSDFHFGSKVLGIFRLQQVPQTSDLSIRKEADIRACGYVFLAMMMKVAADIDIDLQSPPQPWQSNFVRLAGKDGGEPLEGPVALELQKYFDSTPNFKSTKWKKLTALITEMILGRRGEVQIQKVIGEFRKVFPYFFSD